MHRIARRTLLGGGAAIAASALFPIPMKAQAKTLTTATSPDMWSELHQEILAPAFEEASGASVRQTVISGPEQLKQLMDGRSGPAPFDVALFNSLCGQEAVKQGLIAEYPVAQSPNYMELQPRFQNKWGPCITVGFIGIGYNPKSVAPAKRWGWDELWLAKYKGRVGLIAPTTLLGITFLAELNRLKGGTEDDFEPAFKALRELLPNVGGIATNSKTFETLWEREQIDIAPHSFNLVEAQKARNIPVELAIPETGRVGWFTSLHLVANAVEPELAVKYIDTHLDAAIQAKMLSSAYRIIPTNSKLKVDWPVTKAAAEEQGEFGKIRGFDWEKLYSQREALIERFNKAIKL
jgi:putative spermidine/putrescine transport system substrate-binding protein